MGWVGPLLGLTAAWFYYRGGHFLLMWSAMVAAVGCFWTRGIMHNFAVEAAKHRASYTGRFSDLTKREVAAAPNGITALNMLFTLAALGLLIAAFII
jgi:hypothetical protein